MVKREYEISYYIGEKLEFTKRVKIDSLPDELNDVLGEITTPYFSSWIDEVYQKGEYDEYGFSYIGEDRTITIYHAIDEIDIADDHIGNFAVNSDGIFIINQDGFIDQIPIFKVI